MIEAYRGAVSLPCVAIMIIDYRGIESLRVLAIE